VVKLNGARKSIRSYQVKVFQKGKKDTQQARAAPRSYAIGEGYKSRHLFDLEINCLLACNYTGPECAG